jgi:hypothetical protein
MTPLLLPSRVVALLFAAILAGVFGLVLRRPGPWGSVFWMFLVAALVVTLLVAATTEPRPRPKATSAEAAEAQAAAVAAGVLFWAMMILLIVLVITGGVVLSI